MSKMLGHFRREKLGVRSVKGIRKSFQLLNKIASERLCRFLLSSVFILLSSRPKGATS